jgi:hypothetical protein
MRKLLAISSFAISAITSVVADLSNSPPVLVTAHNSSVPAVDGKDLWIHWNGLVYVDAGVANPRYSYQLIAYLENTKLRRIRNKVTIGPGSSPGTEGNLNFGTCVLDVYLISDPKG